MAHWLSVALSLLVAATVLVAAEGLGGFLLRRLPMGDAGGVERASWRGLTGLTALAVTWTVAGLAGAYHGLLFLVSVALGLLLGVGRWRKALAAGRASGQGGESALHRRLGWPTERWQRGALLFLLTPSLALAGVVAWGAALPEVFYDALYYHLGLPWQYLVLGRIALIETVVHSAFPAYLDLLFGGVMGIGGPAAAKSLNALFYPLGGVVTALLYRQLRGRWDVGAWVAALVAVAAPGVVVMATMCSVDVALLVVGGMTMLGALRVSSGANGRRWAILSGLAAGLSIGSKYTGFYILLSALVLILTARRTRAALVDVAILVGVALLVAALWYGRNLLLLGDPVYPVLGSWLDPNGPGAWALVRIRRDLPDFGWGPLGWWQLATTLIWHPDRLGAGAQLGWLLAFAPVAVLIGAWRSLALRPVALSLALFGVLWSLQAPAGRYLFAILPLLAAAAVQVISSWPGIGSRARYAAAAIVGIVSLGQAVTAAQITGQLYGSGAWQVHSGASSRQEFLDQELPYHAAARWLRDNTEPGAGVLFVGETRLLHVDRPVRFASAYDRPELSDWIGRFPEPRALNQHLRQLGLRYVLINRGELDRLRRAYDHLMLPGAHQDRVAAWLRTRGLVYEGRGIQVCEIAGEPQLPPPSP